MKVSQKSQLSSVQAVHRFSSTIKLSEGRKTTLHVVRYHRKRIQPRIVAFETPTLLSRWCNQAGIQEALVGSFFSRSTNRILGECVVDGVPQLYQPFSKPWRTIRGSLHIDSSGELEMGARTVFSHNVAGDLLQAGPLLIKHGSLAPMHDPEGFSSDASQFDSDITIGRYPRAGIATNKQYIWSVTCDGRTTAEAGFTFTEFAQVLQRLGATNALNLDGGGSCTQVSAGKLLNKPRSTYNGPIRERKIYNAIVFNT